MQVIKEFFSKLSSGSIDEALSLVSENAKFIGVREEEYDHCELYGTYHGHEGVREFISILKKVFDTQTFEIHTVLENEEHGFACGWFSHKVKETGKMFESDWAVHMVIETGKIRQYRFFEDTARLEAALKKE